MGDEKPRAANPTDPGEPRDLTLSDPDAPDAATRTLDLTEDAVAEVGAAPPPPPTEQYDVSRLLEDQESARATIAYILLAMLGAVIVFSFVLLWAKPYHSEQLHALLQLIFAPLVALVGAATGYYFGAASAAQHPKK